MTAAKKAKKTRKTQKKQDYLKICEEEVFHLQTKIKEIKSLYEIKKDSILVDEVTFVPLEELAMDESEELSEKQEKRELFLWREEADIIPDKDTLFFPNMKEKEELLPLERCKNCVHMNGSRNCPYRTIFNTFRKIDYPYLDDPNLEDQLIQKLKKIKSPIDLQDICPEKCNAVCFFSRNILIEAICLQSATESQIRMIEQTIKIHDECMANGKWGEGCNVHEFIPLVRNGLEIRNLKIDYQESLNRWEKMFNAAEGSLATDPQSAEMLFLEILQDLWSLRIELKMHRFSVEGQFISALDKLRNKITNCISFIKSGSNTKLVERLSVSI